MPFFDEFRGAIADYVSSSVDVSLRLGPVFGGPIMHASPPREGANFLFVLTVQNRGEVGMKDVFIVVTGSAWARPLMNGAPSSTATYGPFTVDPHSSITRFLHANAIEDTNGVSKEILSPRVERWDADLTHLLNAHSGGGSPEGGLTTTVLP